jgi:hypothetical protein
MPTDEVDSRVEPLPGPFPGTSLRRGRREAATDGLAEADDTGLPGEERVERHGAQNRTSLEAGRAVWGNSSV